MKEMRKKWPMRRMTRKMRMSRWHSSTNADTHVEQTDIHTDWPLWDIGLNTTDNWQKRHSGRKIGKIPLTCRWLDKQKGWIAVSNRDTDRPYKNNRHHPLTHSSLKSFPQTCELCECVDCFLLLIPSLHSYLKFISQSSSQPTTWTRTISSLTCSWPSLCHLTNNRISHHLTSHQIHTPQFWSSLTQLLSLILILPSV